MATMHTHMDDEIALKAMSAANLFEDMRAKPQKPRFSDLRARAGAEKITPFAKRGERKTASRSAEDDSAHQEFLKRRDRLARMGRENPTVRLASFLVALVHMNPDEGSGAFVISETTDARFVADLLSLSLEDLTQLLLQFKADGLVAPLPNGSMRITNLSGLERLADGLPLSRPAAASEGLSEVHRVIVEPPRVYTRAAAAETVLLREYDNAIRFDVFTLTASACLLVALGIALGIVGL